MPPTLYLIDGHALAYRMYFALTGGYGASPANRWQTSKGEPTAGIYGFARELLRIYEQEKPDYLAVAFDTGKTFRDTIFPDYKATRAKMPEDLRPQIERIRQIVDAFNIPRLEIEGFEADDVLGSAARWAAGQGLGVKIITGDRDLLQLVNEHTIVYLAGDDQNYITREDVFRKLHVYPEQVVDYKALVGDKSDNIPGVPGVGEKTAEALLAKYQTLDGIYAHLDEIEPRWRSKLEAGKDLAYLSRSLAQIRVDLPITLDLSQARPDAFDPRRVRHLFEELEFRSLLDKLQRISATSQDSSAPAQQLSPFDVATTLSDSSSSQHDTQRVRWTVVDSPQALAEVVQRLRRAEAIALDTETTSTEEMNAELVGISLAMEAGQGYYLPVGHRDATQLPLELVLESLRPALTNPRLRKIGHNLKYDFIVLARYGLRLEGLAFDTMIAEWLLDPNSHNLGLKALAEERLGWTMTPIETLIGNGRKQISMAEVPISQAAPYAVADAVAAWELRPVLQDELGRYPKLAMLFEQVEMPLVAVLADMELQGVALDVE
ncbi:MAG: 5'-3' exonuclease H3TH domain-containing protein, partial [Anaerolineales bacterium]|nr:5'-3' exonuclease H3TH domain-containing protein [Anaerolineales bacterium]